MTKRMFKLKIAICLYNLTKNQQNLKKKKNKKTLFSTIAMANVGQNTLADVSRKTLAGVK